MQSIAIVFTDRSRLGSQEVAVPAAVSTAAPRFLTVPPWTVVKVPPRYIVLPAIASTLTELLRLGFQGVSVPEVASTAAAWLLAVPPLAVVKVPPR